MTNYGHYVYRAIGGGNLTPSISARYGQKSHKQQAVAYIHRIALLAAFFVSISLLCSCREKTANTTLPALEDLRQEAKRIDQLATDAAIAQQLLEDSLYDAIPLSQYDEQAGQTVLDLQHQIDSLDGLIYGYECELKLLEDSTQQLYGTHCL